MFHIYLQLISGNQEILISACDGTQTLAGAKNVFPGDVYGPSLSGPDRATGSMGVQVYELVSDGKFTQIYSSVTPRGGLAQLSFTEHQVVSFCQSHPEWLRTGGYATFFLIEKDGQFFLAEVRCCSDGQLHVGVGKLEDAFIWNAVCRPRFVLPEIVKA